MTRRTRAWLGVVAIAVVLGTAMLAAVRVGALTGGSVLAPVRDEVRIVLPGRGGRLSLAVGNGSWVPAECMRHVIVERAGQRVIDTPLFPAPLDHRFGMAVYWIAAEGRDGPYVRLADPAGDLILDLRGFKVFRVTALGSEPWLAPVGVVTTAGYVKDAVGGVTMTMGRPLTGVAAQAGNLLGRVLPGPAGAKWHPASGAPS